MNPIQHIRHFLRSRILLLGPLLALWLSQDPPEPPRTRFTSGKYHRATTDHTVWLGFQSDTSPLPNKFNTIAIVEMPHVWVQVGVMDCDSLVKPCAPGDDITPGDFLAKSCHFVVEVPCSFAAKPRRTTIIGPISCTVVAKRLIGLHDSSIVTAAELLDALWRNRWQ